MKRFGLPVNTANIITVFRICVIPLFVILVLNNMIFFALMVFTAAGISDGLDGFIAKHFNQKTDLGAYLDPIADKLLLSSAFICLTILKTVPVWLTLVVIMRDLVIVGGLVAFRMLHISFEIKPTFAGKCTTAVQLFTVFIVLLNMMIPPAVLLSSGLLFVFAAVITTISGGHYIYVGLTILDEAPKRD